MLFFEEKFLKTVLILKKVFFEGSGYSIKWLHISYLKRYGERGPRENITE